MTDKPENLNKIILDDNIKSQKADALAEISQALKNVDMEITRKQRGEAMVGGLKVMAESEADKATKDVLALRDKQAAEKKELAMYEYEQMHRTAMDALVQRLKLAIRASGDDIASFERHVDMFKTAPNLDLLAIEQKLETGKPPMEESDWKHVEGIMRKLARLEPVDPRKALDNMSTYSGYVLLSELTPAQRTQVLERMLDDPEFHKLIINLTATNYLTIAEGMDLLQKAAPKQPEAKAQYLTAISEINTDGMRRYQEDMAALQKQALELYDMNYHQNIVGKFGNPITYLMLRVGETLGFATMVGNFLANVNLKDMIQNPSKFMADVAGLATNPCFLLGTAAAGATVEYVSGGFGKGWLTGAMLAISKDKSLEADKKAQGKIDQVKVVLKNYPQLTEFYYAHAKEIIALKNAHKEVTLQALGIDYKDLPDRLKTTSKTNYDNNLNQFAVVLMDAENGLALKSEAAQKEFIEKTMPKDFMKFTK